MSNDLVIPDKNFWDASSIDTDAWLKEVTDEVVEWPDLDIVHDSDELRYHDSNVPKAILQVINNRLGQVGPYNDLDDYGRRANRKFDPAPYELMTHDNTSNNENDFDNGFAYAVFAPKGSDWVWAHDVYIAVSSGEYRGVGQDFTLYRVDSPADSGFLDWTLGWWAEYLDGSDVEEFNERASPGYSSHPTSEVEDFLKKYRNSKSWDHRRERNIVQWSEKHQTFVSRDKTGRTIKFYPYINVS